MAFRWTGASSRLHGMGVLIPLALALFGHAPAALAATVERVAVEDDRIVIRFDESVGGAVGAAAAFMLDGPRRIAVDVTGATPGRPAEAGGPVTAIRQGARGDGTRLVFDLAAPAVVTDGRFGDGGRELTLSLRAVDDRRFARASAAGPLSFLPGFGERRPRYKVVQEVPPAKRAKLPKVEGDDSRPLVVIDAGHGGVDPGAIGPDGVREKDVTLRIARAIRDELLASGRVRVALTRDADRYLVLRERYGVARKLKADLFISVHCDAAAHPEATGASVYTLSEVASDKEAARLAARENKADIIQGLNLGEAPADVSSILIDLAQRETMNLSAGFARLLGREAKPLIPVKENFHRMASLMVLKAPDMPSVLFETGYISNADDARFLASDEGRAKVAESVRRAVEVHFAKRLAAR
jgi:N-acetylmuramoyl-L-alanine amidase